MTNRRRRHSQGALVGNTTDEAQIQRAKETIKQRTRRMETELADLCKDPRFRDFIWELLIFCNVYHTVFTGHDPTTNFNAGKQDVGHYLLAKLLKAKPDVYITMQLEHTPEPEQEEADGDDSGSGNNPAE